MTITIVVVDDNDIDRYLVKRVIESLDLDARLIEFPDGVPFVDVINDNKRSAAEIGESPPPILVLLDINMPRMGGFEVLESMQSILTDDTQFMFVTMYSSSSYAQDRADADKYPFVKDFITKPITKETLKQLVQKLYPEE